MNSNIENDKLLHFSCSAIIAVIAKYSLFIFTDYISASIISFVITCIIGFCKELYDGLTHKRVMDKKDFYFDAIGALFGSL